MGSFNSSKVPTGQGCCSARVQLCCLWLVLIAMSGAGTCPQSRSPKQSKRARQQEPWCSVPHKLLIWGLYLGEWGDKLGDKPVKP